MVDCYILSICAIRRGFFVSGYSLSLTVKRAYCLKNIRAQDQRNIVEL